MNDDGFDMIRKDGETDMADTINMHCPVCDAEQKQNGMLSVACPNCKFEMAYVRYFMGQKSKELWNAQVKNKKRLMNIEHLEKIAAKSTLVITNNLVAQISDRNVLTIYYGDERVETIENVKQFSASERNAVILFQDGSIRVTGDNSQGQCNCQGMDHLAYALAGPNCVYVVREDGLVAVLGVNIDHAVYDWKNIKSICMGAYHVLGLTGTGTVMIAGSALEPNVVEKVSKWKNVKAIAAATDCSLALFQDGTVGFAGRDDDPRKEAENWKDIIALKADSAYAVGLNRDGNILLAGTCKSYLDMGRSKAREWKDITMIACGKSSIAGISQDGKLYVAGNFSGNLDYVKENWNSTFEVRSK